MGSPIPAWVSSTSCRRRHVGRSPSTASTPARTARRFSRRAARTLTGNFDASFALSPSTAIGTTLALSSTGAYENAIRTRYGVTEPSLVLTTEIPHYYQFYAEYVFVSKVGPNDGGRAFTDFGVQKLLGTRTEIDVEYGHAFTGDRALQFDYVGSGLVLQLW